MQPMVLVVDDEARFRELYAATLAAAGLGVRTAAEPAEARRILEAEPVAMVVSDVRMPGESGLELLQAVRARHPAVPFLLVTAYADVREAVDALKLGAVDYLQKPADLDELVAAVQDALGVREAVLPAASVPPEALRGVVAESAAMRTLLADAYRVAVSDATVLLQGESGVGKEVLAAFLHANSRRADRPLVAVNAAAIAPTLLASELFGHAKGAFTGAASARLGRFREADGGTLFLDEIGDLPLELQPALLRALELGEVQPVGSDGTVRADFRLIAATNCDLPQRIREGRFREDLYHRLNVIAFAIPPLRERREDVLPLARHFLAAGGSPARLSPAAAGALEGYAWPGNVRELANAMARARILAASDVILPEHLPPAVRGAAPGAAARPALDAAVRTLDEAERDEIVKALRQAGQNRTRAAALLGISRRAMLYKLRKYAITG